ncbi:hypothetical protein SAMN04244553_1148 [Nocardia amikacinitolerans]|uniref:Uncharacterized protein n=1 Tax=Nocardia amikacinitolerans TaxID=756689 RepID=A0A285KZ83_9NOCA|nr:hypothetical protein [Nocardia amikacinitolerans]SNY77964.1 hypothetical protein SAMN04244553_1148 [Nocardia amikacinitolerans]
MSTIHALRRLDANMIAPEATSADRLFGYAAGGRRRDLRGCRRRVFGLEPVGAARGRFDRIRSVRRGDCERDGCGQTLVAPSRPDTAAPCGFRRRSCATVPGGLGSPGFRLVDGAGHLPDGPGCGCRRAGRARLGAATDGIRPDHRCPGGDSGRRARPRGDCLVCAGSVDQTAAGAPAGRRRGRAVSWRARGSIRRHGSCTRGEDSRDVAGVSGEVIGKFAVAFGDRALRQARAIAGLDGFGSFRPHVSWVMSGVLLGCLTFRRAVSSFW